MSLLLICWETGAQQVVVLELRSHPAMGQQFDLQNQEFCNSSGRCVQAGTPTVYATLPTCRLQPFQGAPLQPSTSHAQVRVHGA